MTPEASARSPTDSVPGEGAVKVPQDFISGLKLNLIDFEGELRSSPSCRSQLIKPSELGVCSIFLKLESYSSLVPDIFVTGIRGCSITVIILKVPPGSCTKYKLVQIKINTT